MMKKIIGLLLALVLFVFSTFFVLIILLGGGNNAQQASASTCKPSTSTSTPSSQASEDTPEDLAEKTEPEPEEENTESSAQAEELINVPEEYKQPIKDAAAYSGLPETIVAKQIKQESGFDRFAGSPAGAKGPAQFIDSTWAAYGNGGDIYDIKDALAAYGRYMKDLAQQIEPLAKGDKTLHLHLTLAAYNAGPGAVLEYGGIPPYPETTHYIEVITSGAQIEMSSGCSNAGSAGAWDGDLGDGEWTNPCPGCIFTSGYGLREIFPPGDWRNNHVGIDLASPGAGRSPGTVIIAPTDMKVVGFLPNDGCVTTKQNGAPGFQFNFCHLDSWSVSEGQELNRGDIIGIEGGRGGGTQWAYDTHLHFEIYNPESPVPAWPYNGHNLNPEPILKEKGAWVES
ncbi:peptidoglycan DD-metalloendopeptidase family protein [Rothia sp. ZJ932]|uniref:peptidoglycan DD-metalloendopeptidase family protein n=1 Tax=Rothia sp. ZJ932 TaxID=2810516 RepID=UPI0019673745|nr:peptidoglycan DD-metalloendopeptidase family protein [Rothia sp. ZJ932]QRZ61784.1 peptidoglycan DD-metalloendopeptidase family protein [Rothia sp. ZJ932]